MTDLPPQCDERHRNPCSASFRSGLPPDNLDRNVETRLHFMIYLWGRVFLKRHLIGTGAADSECPLHILIHSVEGQHGNRSDRFGICRH